VRRSKKAAVDIVRKRNLGNTFDGGDVVSYQNAALAVTGLDDLMFPFLLLLRVTRREPLPISAEMSA
jgi:hypothetical protein